MFSASSLAPMTNFLSGCEECCTSATTQLRNRIGSLTTSICSGFSSSGVNKLNTTGQKAEDSLDSSII